MQPEAGSINQAGLADRLELADLVARLSYWLDESEYDDPDMFYAAGAVVESPRGRAEGPSEIRDYLRRNSVVGERSHHLTTDVVIGLNGDEASVRANQLVSYYRDGTTPHLTVGLRHSYLAVRTASGWRLQRATITPQWFDRRDQTIGA